MPEPAKKTKPLFGTLIKCAKCGYPIIERLPNGLWRFKFGRKPRKINGEKQMYDTVHMLIHGSIKIRCYRYNCGHWNVLNYFPLGAHESSGKRGNKS